jgi:hypothetical protein
VAGRYPKIGVGFIKTPGQTTVNGGKEKEDGQNGQHGQSAQQGGHNFIFKHGGNCTMLKNGANPVVQW